MKTSPKLSVVMITYGHEPYIQKAIEGVLMQKTDFVFEFIIANDHSPDRTDEIIQKSISNPPSNILIKYINRKENKGAIANLYDALEQTSTDFIAFCEGDDYWTDPQKLQEQFKLISENQNIGLIYSDVDFFDFNSQIQTPSIYKKAGKIRTQNFEEHLEKKGYLAPPTWLFRKDLLQYLDQSNVADFTFCLALEAFKNSEIYYLDKVTAVRNIVPNSATSDKDSEKNFTYRKGVFDIQKKYVDKYSVSKDLTDKIFSSSYIEILPLAIKHKDDAFLKEAKDFFELKNISFDALEQLSKKYLLAEKKSDNKVNNLYGKLRKYF